MGYLCIGSDWLNVHGLSTTLLTLHYTTRDDGTKVRETAVIDVFFEHF
jgi:hypothetical protein